MEQRLDAACDDRFGSTSYVLYVGLGALTLNIVVAAIMTVLVGLISPKPQSALRDAT
jgi:hypothetical protein